MAAESLLTIFFFWWNYNIAILDYDKIESRRDRSVGE